MQTVPENEQNTVAAVFKSHEGAEAAVKQLDAAGVDMRKLSIIGRGYEREQKVLGYYTTGERMKDWAKRGALWGGVWGWLIGLAMFVIPGLGAVAIAGPIVPALLSALRGAVVVGGASALGAGLVGLGIPKDSVIQYEEAIKADQFVLVVNGTADEVSRAREILSRTQPLSLEEHVAVPA
ncbi:MAG: DUF1269 domain-containing protein [Chloroflexi bacterium]|nr:DUF1269 domain-containing protein [Chloroflexota bacterium]